MTFLFLHRFIKTRSFRDLFGAASFFILQFYSCGYYGLFLAFFVGIFLLLAWWRAGPSGFDLLGKFAVFFLFSLMMILPGYLPYLKLRRDFGFTRPLEEAVFFSADMLTYLIHPLENRLWGKALQHFGSRKGDLFMGLTAFLLTLDGIVGRDPAKEIRGTTSASLRPPRSRASSVYIQGVWGDSPSCSFH